MKGRSAFLVSAILILAGIPSGSAWLSAAAAYPDSDLRTLRTDRSVWSATGSPLMLEETKAKPVEEGGAVGQERSPASEKAGKKPWISPAYDSEGYRLRIWDR